MQVLDGKKTGIYDRDREIGRETEGDGMKVKYIGAVSDPLELVRGRNYECLGREKDRYRVIDETGEDYLYPVEEFEEIETTQ